MLGVGDSLYVGGNTDSLSTLVCGPIQDGASPLLAAAIKGHLEVVCALLEGSADVNQANQVCVCVLWRARKCVNHVTSYILGD